jgi:hypothetical protein
VVNRRLFLAGTATAAGTLAAADAAAIPGGTHFVERRADFDAAAFAAAVGRPARIRQVYEAVGFHANVLDSAKNSFNGLRFGFGYPADSIAIALAAHGPSAALTYDDGVWKKYHIGELFAINDASGAPATANASFAARAAFDPGTDPDDPGGSFQDASIQTLQRRGLIVLTCHTAVEEQARAIVRRGFAPGSASAAEVAADILTHLIPGALVVPSMVATLAVLQSVYHYSYVTLTP